MKRFLAIVICVMMLVATMAVSTSAAGTAVEPSGWKRFGDIEIEFNEDLSSTIQFDGRFNDWQSLGIKSNDIDISNLDSWAGKEIPDGATSRIPEDFAIHTYFAADSKYLYIAFDILDDSVVAIPATDTAGSYQGYDGFQIQLDFNNIFANAAETRRAVFYSFGRREDGQMAIMVQESDLNDGIIWATDSEDNLNNIDANGNMKIKGAVTEIEGGWGAEFALSWQMLYEHAFAKMDYNMIDEELDLSFGPDSDFKVAAGVFYLDYIAEPSTDAEGNATTKNVLQFAAGTCSKFGQFSASANGEEGFWPDNCGINLLVKSDEDVNLDVDTVTGEGEEDLPDESDEGTTKPEEKTTEEQSTAAEAGTTAEGTAEEKGCKGAIGIGVVAAAIVAIGAVAFKKKED